MENLNWILENIKDAKWEAERQLDILNVEYLKDQVEDGEMTREEARAELLDNIKADGALPVCKFTDEEIIEAASSAMQQNTIIGLKTIKAMVWGAKFYEFKQGERFAIQEGYQAQQDAMRKAYKTSVERV